MLPRSFATIQTTYGGNMATLISHGLNAPRVAPLGMRGKYMKGNVCSTKKKGGDGRDGRAKMKIRKSALEENSLTFNFLKVLS